MVRGYMYLKFGNPGTGNLKETTILQSSHICKNRHVTYMSHMYLFAKLFANIAFSSRYSTMTMYLYTLGNLALPALLKIPIANSEL